MRIMIFIFFIFLIVSELFSQVVINEIHPAPANEEPEWIELYNAGDNEINLLNSYISDAKIVKVIPIIRIIPKCYLIITKDSTAFLERRILSDSATIIEARLPIFNNTWDIVVLRDADSIVIDSLYYDMNWGSKGISFERIDYTKPASADNLQASIAPDSATPGRWNSVSNSSANIIVKSIIIDENSNSVKIAIKNLSGFPVSDISFSFLIDKNNDGNFSDEEEFIRNNIDILNPEETTEISVDIIEFKNFAGFIGNVLCSAYIHYGEAPNYLSSNLDTNLYLPIPMNSIFINEFMYDVAEGRAEYIELVNISSENISLNGVLIHDSYKKAGYDSIKIEIPCPLLKANSFIAVSTDSAILDQFPNLRLDENVYIRKSNLSLNLYGDDIILIAPDYIQLDSVTYDNYWHSPEITISKGISLEKINPNLLSTDKLSWSSSLSNNGGTPGMANSLYQENISLGSITASPNPFAPSGRNNDRFCIINYILPYENAEIKVDIYDINGRKVRKLIGRKITSREGNITWDGRNDDEFSLPIGAYVLILEASDIASGNKYSQKIMIVIGS